MLETGQPRRSVAPQPKGRSAAVTMALAGLAMLLSAVGLRLLQRGEAQAHRVVVGAHGCGSRCDADLARSLVDELRVVGFDTVTPRHDKAAGLGTPEGLRRFAREHGAGFAVMLLLEAEPDSDREDDLRRVEASVTLYVMDATQKTPPVPTSSLRAMDEAKTPESALALLGRRLVQGLLPVTASALLSSEAVKRLQADASGLEQQAAALALRKRADALRAREDAMRDYRLHCEANDELLQESGRCVSQGCAEEYLVGVLPNGTAVVHDSSDTAVFPLEPSSTARSLLTGERLWLVPQQGPRKLLTQATNFYSRADLSQDGGTLAFLERRHGHTRLYRLELGSGKRALVDRRAPPASLSEPHLSADGTRLLYYAIEPDGRARLLVASPGKEPREVAPHALDARFVELALAGCGETHAASLPSSQAVWRKRISSSCEARRRGFSDSLPEPGAATRRFVAALVPGSATGSAGTELEVQVFERTTGRALPSEQQVPSPALELIDPETGELLVRLESPEHRLRALGGQLPDGTLVLTWEDEACGFARYRFGQPISYTRTLLCPKHLVVSGGEVLGHALVGGTEGATVNTEARRQLVRLDLEKGALEVLTHGSQDSQNPRLSGDPTRTAVGLPGPYPTRVAYERVLPRRYGELQHVAVCFLR